MNTNEIKNDELIADEIFREIREKSYIEESKEFKKLPNGSYDGRVYIESNRVISENSPNKGRQKYEIRLTVAKGDYKGRMAYYHRVRFPSYLADAKPPENDSLEIKKWRDKVKNYQRETDKIFQLCGVDTSDIEPEEFVRRIGENNSRRSIVNFTVKGEKLYINKLVSTNIEYKKGSLPLNIKANSIPDGNDVKFI